mgnify:CR=1 FL=1
MARLHYDFYVYIMASISRVLYVGVTNNLIKRTEEHKDEIVDGFSKKYKTKKLVYYEYFTDINYAIMREKEIKKWRREKKIALIEGVNSQWKDLYFDIIDRDPSFVVGMTKR